MARLRRTRRVPSSLEARMVLHGFMCDQFGYDSLRGMLERLSDVPAGFMGGGASRFAEAMTPYIHPHSEKVSRGDLARYDDNIIAVSDALGMTDDSGRTWKPFQYLALLFTERYLDLYFQDREVLIAALNQWKAYHYEALEIDDYTAGDIHTLAFQSATGSGKTLLLHANILQYQRYLKEHKLQHKLNRIVLVTPDEGLSRQHLRELQASRIPARLFSDNESAGNGLGLYGGGAVVDIIDLHKLDTKKGIKRVALESFEENNLVLVDEGHLGTGGKVWRKRRKQLARNGFTFEYSATFNQAVAGSGEGVKELRDQYGKQILFDYSYKFFYADGYGKDYKISNLQQSDDGEANNRYLLACLLSFYQQCRLYEDKGGRWRDFNIAPPLWVFLGKTVTGGKSAGKAATETDVIRIIRFLAWVLRDRQPVTAIIEELLSGTTGLVDEKGADIFSRSFPYIGGGAQAVYDDLCLTVFRGRGQLLVSILTAADELQLAAGDSQPFGVINVGDATGLYARLESIPKPRTFALDKNAFARPLFADVDNDNSPVSIVIGARKFAAGWNSWRVSTMGLMHVGTGEGPQIIQMFGRGVRLKGRGMSLKRHTALGGAAPTDSAQLKLLETLNIFGLKANYMDKFKAYLAKEGVKVDRVTFQLPTTKQFSGAKHLKIIKKRDDAGEFQHAETRFDLPAAFGARDAVTLERQKYVQMLESERAAAGGADDKTTDGKTTGGKTTGKESCKLENRHLALMNMQTVYHKVLERKRRFAWHNMTIARETVNALLEDGNNEWYTLNIAPEKLEGAGYDKVREWEDLAADLICEYAGRRWRKARDQWEHAHLEVTKLDAENPNYVEEYELSVPVDTQEKRLLRDIERLVEAVKSGQYDEEFQSGEVQMSLLTPVFHAYKPLLYIPAGSKPQVQASPVALNENEAKFVEYLKEIHGIKENVEQLQGKAFYLMRNLSGGKGVSFFDDYHFYPDFILWVKDDARQDILFIDPKGLAYFNAKVASKVDLHARIKATEAKIKEKHPDLFLHAYIWSHTEPKHIGSERALTLSELRQRGIYLARGPELIELLKHALQCA